ncbi:hypothetical protein ACFVY9_01565 [Streptomyces sp. NPDC059544]|uniref:hypothetical protein n=1 Tax=Streptomyces sp. NPDC059544 TaxID=3346861 RepID=UPI00367939EE
MTNPLPHALAALPLLSWFGHSLWLSRRLSAARRDPLTGLPTRAAFTARAHRALRRPDASVLLLDLDHVDRTKDERFRVSRSALISGPVRDMQPFEGGAACLHPTRSLGISSQSVLLAGGGSCLSMT